jgi:hypothetical protein
MSKRRAESAKRDRAEVTPAELRAHVLRLDRYGIDLFGLWMPLWPLIVFCAVVAPAYAGWEAGNRDFGLLGGVLWALTVTALSILFVEKLVGARVLPRALLPRRRRLDRCLDLALLRQSITEVNRRLAVTEPGSPDRWSLEADLRTWREKQREVEGDLDAVEARLAASFEDWRRYLGRSDGGRGGAAGRDGGPETEGPAAERPGPRRGERHVDSF